MSDNMTKRAKEYMNADFVYEDYKNLAEAQKIADVEEVTAISERLIKQNMEAYKELAKFVQEKLPEKYQTVRLYLQLMKYNR